MLIDTHCHINIMLRGYLTKEAYQPLSPTEIIQAQAIIDQAKSYDTTTIINVGTDLIESLSCIELARLYHTCYAIVGIHPNDAKENWRQDFAQLMTYVQEHQVHKIIGLGECGIDLHYENYNLQRQKDVFKAHIELALQYDLGLSIHSRDAAEETFGVIDEYKKETNFRGIMHCYSYNESYAQEAINAKLALGIGGTLTYPKNQVLRSIVQTVDLNHIVLETDAPFLPPQSMRGKTNSPAFIKIFAEFIAELKNTSYENVAQKTTHNVQKLFKLPQEIA